MYNNSDTLSPEQTLVSIVWLFVILSIWRTMLKWGFSVRLVFLFICLSPNPQLAVFSHIRVIDLKVVATCYISAYFGCVDIYCMNIFYYIFHLFRHKVVIVEGNYLLLEDGVWKEISSLFDEKWQVLISPRHICLHILPVDLFSFEIVR